MMRLYSVVEDSDSFPRPLVLHSEKDDGYLQSIAQEISLSFVF